MSSQNVGANTSGNDASKQPKVVEDAIAEARKAIADLLQKPDNSNLGPHFIRIAFYDAISYNPSAKVDGPNGSIRIWDGLAKEAEMKKAIETLDNLKATKNSNVWPYVSYADLYQLAGIEAVKKAGGPSTIEFQHGRTDSCIPIHSSKLPIIDDDTSADSLKATFHRIGFTDKEIVALSAAYYYWMNCTQFSQLKFDTSYYEKLLELSKLESSNAANTSSATIDKQPSISTLATLHYWKCLLSDASFRKHVELFASTKDANSFGKEYASAHKKLSELGFKHFPEPILTEADCHDVKHGIAFAVAMTILFGFVGFFYEVMRS